MSVDSPLISNDEPVLVLSDFSQLRQTKIKDIVRFHHQDYDLNHQQDSEDKPKKGFELFASSLKPQIKHTTLEGCAFKNIMLHFESLTQPYQPGLRFVAFVYDECLNVSDNCLMLLDTETERIAIRQLVTQREHLKKFVYFDQFDLQKFKVCRTSEVSKPVKGIRSVNYQVFNFYVQKLGLIEVQEYQLQYDEKKADGHRLQLFGWKNFYLSQGLMERANWEDVVNFRVFSYRSKHSQRISGSQIVLEERKDNEMKDLSECDGNRKRRIINLVEDTRPPECFYLSQKLSAEEKEECLQLLKDLKDSVAMTSADQALFEAGEIPKRVRI